MAVALGQNYAILKLSLIAAIILLLMTLVTQQAVAQSFTVLHKFSGPDGAIPEAGVTIDSTGTLYGTTTDGGLFGLPCGVVCGVAFRLEPRGSSWTFAVLYNFQGPLRGDDGSKPAARPVFGPNRILYGTTMAGGTGVCQLSGCGTVYSLGPNATPCVTASFCYWSESVLYSFADSLLQDPGSADLIFDRTGNIYGTADSAVYKLTKSDGAWTESTLHKFLGGDDGEFPMGGVIFGQAGSLYGTTLEGGGPGCYGAGCGTVFQMTFGAFGWQEKILHVFSGGSDGRFPAGGLVSDDAGNLYGTTAGGGQGGGGTVFMLTPSGDQWIFQLLHSFTYSGSQVNPGPAGSLTRDAAGNLYGTTLFDGLYGAGSVFRLTQSNGEWQYVSLHDFTGGTDGAYPYGSVTFDGTGNLYGTAAEGGRLLCNYGSGCGVVYQIRP